MKISLKVDIFNGDEEYNPRALFYQKTKKRTHSLFGRVIDLYIPAPFVHKQTNQYGRYLISPWYEESFKKLPLIAQFYC